MSEVALQLSEASVRVGGRTVWSDVSMSMEQGEFVALLGANGSGKSTLLKVALGMLRLQAGNVSVLGGPPGEANARIGYLPQRRAFDGATRLRGQDIVRMGCDGTRWGVPLPVPRRSAAHRRRLKDTARVTRAIELVGAEEYAARAIGELSGGEQQRLLIAQALVQDPRLLLLDEPLDSLDLPTQGTVARLVADICRREGVGVLLVAHDVNPLLPYLDRVVYLAGGKAVQGAVSEVIDSETLSGLYGVPVEVLTARDGRLVVVGQPDPPAHHHDRHDHGHEHEHEHGHGHEHGEGRSQDPRPDDGGPHRDGRAYGPHGEGSRERLRG